MTHKLKPVDQEKIICAYAAGIFDADGSVYLTKSETRNNGAFQQHTLRIAVANTSKNLISWLQKHFGGRVGLMNGSKQANTKDAHFWSLNGKSGIPFLKAITEFLIVKKSRAQLALEFSKTISTPGVQLSTRVVKKRQNIYTAMKRLNKRGRK